MSLFVLWVQLQCPHTTSTLHHIMANTVLYFMGHKLRHFQWHHPVTGFEPARREHMSLCPAL